MFIAISIIECGMVNISHHYSKDRVIKIKLLVTPRNFSYLYTITGEIVYGVGYLAIHLLRAMNIMTIDGDGHARVIISFIQ